jgi:hypothetical protein
MVNKSGQTVENSGLLNHSVVLINSFVKGYEIGFAERKVKALVLRPVLATRNIVVAAAELELDRIRLLPLGK